MLVKDAFARIQLPPHLQKLKTTRRASLCPRRPHQQLAPLPLRPQLRSARRSAGPGTSDCHSVMSKCSAVARPWVEHGHLGGPENLG